MLLLSKNEKIGMNIHIDYLSQESNTSDKNNKSGGSNQKKEDMRKNVFSPNSSNSPNGKSNFYWIYGVVAIVLIAMSLPGLWDVSSKEIGWKRFEEMVRNNDLDKIIIVNDGNAELFLTPEVVANGKYDSKDGKKISKGGPHFIYVIGDYKVFRDNLDKLQEEYHTSIDIQNEKRQSWGFVMEWIFPLLMIFVLWFFFMRMMGRGAAGGAGGIFSVGKSKAKLYNKETSVKVSFKDVAGLEEAKVEVMEIVDFLKQPDKYTRLGGKIPKGALLVGPPGTGKTLLAKAVAGEAQVPFFSISGSDFVEMFVGVGASRVRDLFKQAKEKSPCIVFIDEIDAIGRTRGKNVMSGGNDERENTLNQLLTEMDGFEDNTGVIILAATNRVEILDKALLRAGRFDRQIHVDLPDLTERFAIFKVHMKGLSIDKNTVSVDTLAKHTPGFSGADIANVCNEAALIAARSNKKTIDKQSFSDAIDRIVGGLEKKNKIISPVEKKVIAYHEAGHAAVSWMTKHAHPLVKVTIVPRGQSLGAAWYLPQERQITTFEQMFDELTSTMAGRASEEVNFGKVSTGALNDLEKASKQAYTMVVFYGLNEKIGNVSYFDSSGQQEYSFQKPYSEKTAEIIDAEIKKLIESAYQRAIEIIKENTEKIKELAEYLLEKEVILTDDVERILGPRPFADKLKWEEENAKKEMDAIKKNGSSSSKEDAPQQEENELKKEN
jgi:cell division protease FtsH